MATQVSPGTVTLRFQAPTRTVVPDWNSSLVSYGITLHCTSAGVADITKVVTPASPSVPSVPQGTWDVSVTAYNAADVAVASGTSSVTIDAGGVASPSPVPVVLSGSQTGTGGYGFTFRFPSALGIDRVTGTLLTSGGAAVASPAGDLMTQTAFTTVGSDSQGTFTNASLPGGTYLLALKFYRGTVLAGAYTEAINVFFGVTANQWVSADGTLKPYRGFVDADFGSSSAALSGLVVTSAGSPVNFEPAFTPSTKNYCDTTNTSVVVVPSASMTGQTLRYQINGGAWTSTSSGLPLPSVTPGSTVKIQVTAADGVSTSLYTYSAYKLVVVGSIDHLPGFWQNGVWNLLPLPPTKTYANNGMNAVAAAVSGSDVYVAGSYWDDWEWQFLCWKNGAFAYQSNWGQHTWGSALATEGGNVHATGFAHDNDGWTYFLPYWLNGTGSTLVNNGSTFIAGYAITTSAGNVLIGGTNGTQATVYHGASPIPLASGTAVYGLASSGTNVYAVGTNGETQAVLWTSTNGGASFSAPTVLLAGAANVHASRVLVDGSDVYICGTDGTNAIYWKNGVQTTLGPGQATGIAVLNGKVFVSGTDNLVCVQTQATEAYAAAFLWVDGTLTTLAMRTTNATVASDVVLIP